MYVLGRLKLTPCHPMKLCTKFYHSLIQNTSYKWMNILIVRICFKSGVHNRSNRNCHSLCCTPDCCLAVLLKVTCKQSNLQSNLITVQQDASVFSLLYFCRQLYRFQVLTPIVRSWYSCNYSFWY